MSSPTRLVVRFTPLPPGFRGNLNKFCRAFIDRMEVVSPFSGLQWQIGGLKPTSNVGPWLNDAGQPFVWDETLKDYVPLDISLSLDGIEGEIATINTTIAGLVTPSQLAAAIASATASVDLSGNSYAFSGKSTTPQAVISGAGAATVAFNAEDYDLDEAFESGIFTAPVDGIYRFTAGVRVELSAGTPTDIDFTFSLVVNGVSRSFVTERAGSDTAGRTILMTRDIPVIAGQQVTIKFEPNSTGSATFSIDSNPEATFFQGHLIKKT